ncbi:MAG: hypothetical protein D6785_16740 [Planctomycetota bacterium]|nr:MAG: hypothetical protein D6785_16740 [Planctomycetota bacterium]
MTLRKDLNKTLVSCQFSQVEGLIEAVFVTLEDCKFFHGHFPDNPLMPAVLQMEWARILLDRTGFGSLQCLQIKKAKFHQPILPGEKVDFKMEIKKNKNILEAKCLLGKGNQKVSRFTLLFKVNAKENINEKE